MTDKEQDRPGHGHWERSYDGWFHSWECSVCRKNRVHANENALPNFCAYCGADMRKEDNT